MSGGSASLGPTLFVASSKSRENADRRAAKKAAAAAEKTVDRRKPIQSKTFEKGRAAKDKAAEKEVLSALGSQPVSSPKANLVQNPVEVCAVHVPSPSDYQSEIAKESLVNSDKTFPIKKSVKPNDLSATNKRPEPTVTSPKSFTQSRDYLLSRQTSEISQLPLLSKKPKKTKPVVKSVKASKDEEVHDEVRNEVHDEDLNLPFLHEMSHAAEETADPSSSTSRSQSLDRHSSLTSVEDLLEGLDVSGNPFFDVQRLTTPAKMPLEYGPLVHALSVSSVGGTSTMPSGSIDNAVSSFQQLLETLTQTISELLRLLPRTTWDDSSSFNGVFHDMLKGDDFLDDGEDGSGKDDEVAALTLALERRARWMEVQLSKLEELHRDINTAAVRAILSFNDNGWDQHAFLPRIGNTLLRFDHIALMKEGGTLRPMTVDELEKKLAVAKEAAIFAETEIREAMERFQHQARCE
jgi:CCR4-NOT transcription complex subunit 4